MKTHPMSEVRHTELEVARNEHARIFRQDVDELWLANCPSMLKYGVPTLEERKWARTMGWEYAGGGRFEKIND